jgi:glycosyltransferase involved in cell wall biosynthesis
MEVTRPGFWQNDRLGDLLKDLQTQGRFQGINNGIFFGSFDITREDVLGSLRVAQDYSNYAEKKQEAKKVLFNSGIIGSDTRPLFVYVGRYSREKGIDVLPEFARYIVARGGQIAIMGVLSGGPISPVILELVSMSRDPQYQGLIRVFTSFARDQLALLNSVGVSKGKVIRFASDFTLVPSIMEAAGLVPIEGLSMGSATISSYRQGLKDQCRRPLHFANSDGDIHDIHTFTCVPFERVNDNLRLTLRNLFNRTDAALNEWNELSQHERTEIQINLIREAKKFDWSQEGGALDEYRALYEKARKALP